MQELALVKMAGDVGGMGKDYRLVIPSSVRDALEWFPGKGAKPFALIADLRDDGLVRLHPAGSARSRIDTVKQQLVAGHPDPLEALAALADRYRELKYYSSGTRVHCGAAVGWHLKRASQHLNEFYVEALGKFIDVMTLERRNARLQGLRNDLELPEE